ncbi:MAG: hypothetical protein ABSF84_02700 [Acidimicrobiales bacterium]|jgi:hypothetical protein
MAGSVKQVRRTYRGEEDWFDLLDECGHRALRNAFIEVGVTAQQAMGLVFFLDDQRHLDRHQTHQSRSRHRQILAGLDIASVASAARSIPR